MMTNGTKSIYTNFNEVYLLGAVLLENNLYLILCVITYAKFNYREQFLRMFGRRVILRVLS